MKTHVDLDDETFEMSFRDTSMDPTLFTHEAHLRLAWIHIKKYGVEQAILNICQQIKTFDQTHDDGTNYNKTVTIAAVRAVNHFCEKSGAHSFSNFIRDNSRLVTHFKELLSSHYSIDIFKDGYAKENYLEPDLVPF